MPERRPFLDPNHPMFARPWVRWVTVAVPTLWGAFEFYQNAPAWGVMFLAAGVYAAWVLLIRK